MDRDQIIRLAQEADDLADERLGMRGEYHPDWHDIRDGIFAAAVRAAALEESAQMCEAQEGDATTRAICKGCAAAIRSLASEGESRGE